MFARVSFLVFGFSELSKRKLASLTLTRDDILTVLWYDTLRFFTPKTPNVTPLELVSSMRRTFAQLIHPPFLQSQFHAYCLIWAWKELFSQALRFHPCTTTSIDHWIPKMFLFSSLTKQVFFFFKKTTFNNSF